VLLLACLPFFHAAIDSFRKFSLPQYAIARIPSPCTRICWFFLSGTPLAPETFAVLLVRAVPHTVRAVILTFVPSNPGSFSCCTSNNACCLLPDVMAGGPLTPFFRWARDLSRFPPSARLSRVVRLFQRFLFVQPPFTRASSIIAQFFRPRITFPCFGKAFPNIGV